MAFIAGKGFAILNSKAEKGDQKAKDLLAKLNTIDQDEADRLFSEILGKGGGAKKEKKIKAPGASATDGQGEITEGAGEQAPTGKATPKAKGEAPVAAPAEPTGEVKPLKQKTKKEIEKEVREYADRATPVDPLSGSNLEKLYNSGLNEKEIINKLNEQIKQNELSEIPNNYRVSAEEFVKEYSKMYGAPKGKVTPKESKPADPLSNENLKNTFDKYEGNVDSVLDDLREQQIDISNNDLQDIVEGFAAGYKYNPGEATDKIKQDVARNIQSNIQSDIEPNFQEIADEYGITAQEVQDVYNNEIKAGKQGTQIDTAGANVQPAGAFGDIEPETQQLAGVGNVNDQSKQQARQRIDGIMQEGRGGVSLEEAEALSEEFGIPVDEIRALERQSQSEIAFPAPEGTPIPADQDFDAQGNPIGNINDKEVADELGVDEQELAGLLGPNPLKTLGKTYQGAPWEEENIKNILQQAGGDKAKALELLKQQQANYKDKGPILKDQFLPGLIEQAAAGETNLSLPASDPTAEQLAETDSLFENTPEKEMVAAEQLAGQGNAPLSQLTDKIQTKNILSSNESSVEGTLPNGSQFIVTDTGTGLQYQIVNGPDGDEEPLNVGYDEFDNLVDFINNDGKESGQPATFEVADENNLTPDEFQRMDFEAGEAERGVAFEQPPEYREEENTGIAEFENDNERIGGQGFVRLSNNINFDRSVITNEQIKQVAQELGLEGKTPEQLTQIRNGVVKEGEGRQNSKARTALSAITAAIDSYIMGRNRNKPAAEPAGQGQQTKDKDTGNINGKQYSVELVNGKPVSGVIDGKGFSIDDDGVVTTRGGRGSKDFYESVTSLKRMYQEGLQPREEAANPAQAPAQIKQTAQANAQQAAPAAPAATPQPQQQPGKIDRKKLEQAAGDLGVNADLLEGLLELLKKVR